MHSTAFREEFYGLVRNDEIYVRLYCLHLFLLAERLRMSKITVSNHGLSVYMDHRRAMLALGARRFNRTFY